MIKGLITTDVGKKIILLGLSEKNIVNLKKGLHILIKEPHISEREILIAYGKTEKDMADALTELFGKVRP